jgi:hypothetical protein
MSLPDGSVSIRTEDGEIELIEDVADVAEVTPGRLQVVFTDKTSEFQSGSLFGGYGSWKIWIDCTGDELEKYVGDDPLSMPGDYVKLQADYGTVKRDGPIKRLRRPNL